MFHKDVHRPEGVSRQQVIRLRCRRSGRMVTGMGDKSPKSKSKLADQKQTRVDQDDRKKQAAVAAKQVPQKKR